MNYCDLSPQLAMTDTHTTTKYAQNKHKCNPCSQLATTDAHNNTKYAQNKH